MPQNQLMGVVRNMNTYIPDLGVVFVRVGWGSVVQRGMVVSGVVLDLFTARWSAGRSEKTCGVSSLIDAFEWLGSAAVRVARQS